MPSFTSRQIVIAQTVGERLKKVRLGSSLDLEYVAQQCGIRRSYLESIEAGQYAELPGEVYVMEFIRAYARFLKLPSDEVVRAYRDERAQNDVSDTQNMYVSMFRRKRPMLNRFSLPGVRNSVFALLIVTCSAFGVRFVSSYLNPPQLEIFSPRTYHTVTGQTVVVSGRVDPGTRVLLNDYPILVDEGGTFREEMSIPEGSSLFKVSAIDKNGRRRDQFRAVAVASGQVAGDTVIRTIE